LAQSSQSLAAARCEEAEIAHPDEAFGQHMLQEAVDERFSGECTQFELTRIRRPIAKGYLVVLQLDQAAVVI
jgi:hypothetical protein